MSSVTSDEGIFAANEITLPASWVARTNFELETGKLNVESATGGLTVQVSNGHRTRKNLFVQGCGIVKNYTTQAVTFDRPVSATGIKEIQAAGIGEAYKTWGTIESASAVGQVLARLGKKGQSYISRASAAFGGITSLTVFVLSSVRSKRLKQSFG